MMAVAIFTLLLNIILAIVGVHAAYRLAGMDGVLVYLTIISLIGRGK